MRYFIGLLVALGLLIVLLVLLISGGPKQKVQQKLLTDYTSTDAQVVMTIDGPVNADSLHQQVRVTVDNASVTYEQIKGYQSDVVKTKVFSNNQDAYYVFLRALMLAGYTRGDNNPDFRDERGVCPLGDRYIFELKQDGDILQRYWATSCGTRTYKGNNGLTVTLFEKQVPDYAGLTQGVSL